MPRPSKKTETVENVLAHAVSLMESEKKSATPAKERKPRVPKAVPSTSSAPTKAEKPVKKVKPVKTVSPVLSQPDPLPEGSKRKVFRAIPAELKEKLSAHSKEEGVSKAHILYMKSHLMLGKSWEEAHTLAVAKEKAVGEKKTQATQ